jgi:2-polyprenyl-3-methyl-5-hydroxy-6-metoxy-1,4-benzoquinol methylase
MLADPSTPSTEQTAQFYDDMWRFCGHLDAVSPAAFHRRRVLCKLVTQHAASATTVLDVGCGMGELLRDVAAVLPNAHIFGTDVSPQSLVESARRNPGYELFQMDLTAGDFEARYAERLGKYDLVTCSEVLEHIPEDHVAARNLARLLAPGGTLVVSVPGGRKSRFDLLIGHQRHYRRTQAAALLEQAQLRIVAALAWGFPFHSFYRTAVRMASRFAMEEPGAPSPSAPSPKKKGVSSVLAGGYALMGRVLHPLFYLNLNCAGEQIFVVARKSHTG